jgi:hypothetical protein
MKDWPQEGEALYCADCERVFLAIGGSMCRCTLKHWTRITDLADVARRTVDGSDCAVCRHAHSPPGRI